MSVVENQTYESSSDESYFVGAKWLGYTHRLKAVELCKCNRTYWTLYAPACLSHSCFCPFPTLSICHTVLYKQRTYTFTGARVIDDDPTLLNLHLLTTFILTKLNNNSNVTYIQFQKLGYFSSINSYDFVGDTQFTLSYTFWLNLMVKSYSNSKLEQFGKISCSILIHSTRLNGAWATTVSD